MIFLPLQYILVGIIGYYKSEPWPAFVFPGFKNVYVSEEHYIVRQTRFEFYNNQNQKVATVQPHRFFPGVPRSQIAGLTRTVFHNKNKILNLSSAAREYLYENGKRVTDMNFSRMDITREVDYLDAGSMDLEPDSTARILIAQIDFNN